MDAEEMKIRTKAFGLRVLALADVLPSKPGSRAIAGQIVRCATSVGANYRAACRGKSRADFLAKMKICEEEADESCYWLELIGEAGYLPEGRLRELRKEGDEICAMLSAACKTLRSPGREGS